MIQIYSYGACLRLVTDSSVLLISKHAVRTIEVIRQDSVKLGLGEGPLNEVIIKLSDVTAPAGLVDVADLRDAICSMLGNANRYEENALLRMQGLADQLLEIKQILVLWHSTQEIELNFDQLQVNVLTSIANRLLEAKEGNERLISDIQDQTRELKAQGLSITAANTLLGDIKAANTNANNKQDIQTGIFTDIKTSSGLIQGLATDSVGELKTHSSMFKGLDSLLSDIKSLLSTILTKMDGQSATFSQINTTLTLIPPKLADQLVELKTHTGKLSSIDTTLTAIQSQNTTTQGKLDTQTGKLTSIDTGITDLKTQHTSILAKQDAQTQLLIDIKAGCKK